MTILNRNSLAQTLNNIRQAILEGRTLTRAAREDAAAIDELRYAAPALERAAKQAGDGEVIASRRCLLARRALARL